MTNILRVATRGSALALIQANFVKDLLQHIYPDLEIQLVPITTSGDIASNQVNQGCSAPSLDNHASTNTKGLFIKELEQCLLDNKADIAVHSLKDMATCVDGRFVIPSVLMRENACDVFVSNKYQSLQHAPVGAIIGSSSPRRIAQLKHHYPYLACKSLRGNVDTRLKKLDNDEYDGIILAYAGLKRLERTARITQMLDTDYFVPAIAQGAIAIEALHDNRTTFNIGTKEAALGDILQPINDAITMFHVCIERKIGELLGATCHTPVGVYVNDVPDGIKIAIMLVDNDGKYHHIICKDNADDDFVSIASRCIDKLKNGSA